MNKLDEIKIRYRITSKEALELCAKFEIVPDAIQWGDSLEVRSLLTIEMPGNVHLEYSIKDCNKWHNYWTVVVVDGKLVAERSGVECL